MSSDKWFRKARRRWTRLTRNFIRRTLSNLCPHKWQGRWIAAESEKTRASNLWRRMSLSEISRPRSHLFAQTKQKNQGDNDRETKWNQAQFITQPKVALFSHVRQCEIIHLFPYVTKKIIVKIVEIEHHHYSIALHNCLLCVTTHRLISLPTSHRNHHNHHQRRRL